MNYIPLGGGGGVITDDATATASQLLSGYTAYVKGKKITGSIASQGAQTITPGTNDKTISSGKYLSGTQTIKGDSNLVAGNIKSGASIFGVSGTFTSDANAYAHQILSGRTAYVNGNKITGSMANYANGVPNAIDAVRLQNNRFEIAPARGYHGYSWDDGNYSYLTYSQVANTIGLSAAKIAKGNTILGIAGTYSGSGDSGGYLYLGIRNGAMSGYAFGTASYSNGIRIGTTGSYRIVLFGYNEAGYSGYLRVNGTNKLTIDSLREAAVKQTVLTLSAGNIVTIAASGGVNYGLTGFVYST